MLSIIRNVIIIKDIHQLIHVASISSNPEVIKVLVKAGADVNAKSSSPERVLNGLTPLVFAIIGLNPNPEVIMTLIELGADPKLKSDSGKTPYHYARWEWKLWNTEALKILEEASK